MRSLQRTEGGLSEGVDAFERRMVGMGVMEADARDALGGRGGGLVRGAAQGVDEGEIRPLMIMLAGSVRRRCMPGGEAAWGALWRTEAGLTKGVDVFEVEMAGLGRTEADARDALGGRWGAGGGRVAGCGGVPGWWGPQRRGRRRGRSGG